MRPAVFLLLIATTTHSKAQWEIEDSHTTASLRGIHNVGGGIAWASGSNGTVLRTTDDGKTWKTCPVPLGGTKDSAEKLDFRGIQAFDAQTAIVMSSGPGDQSRLYKTADGCQTWTLVFTNPDKDGFWDAIVLTRSSDGIAEGWILGDPVDGQFRVFTARFSTFVTMADITTRPPQSGSNKENELKADTTMTLTADRKKAGAFAASNSAFFVLQHGPEMMIGMPLPAPPGSNRRYLNETAQLPVEYFVTGGKQGARLFIRQPYWSDVIPASIGWSSLPLPLGSGTDASGAFSIAIRDPWAGVIVGGDYRKPEASARTAAYHNSHSEGWLSAKTPPHGYRSAVAYDPSKKTWITVGPNGTDISTDDGRNWRPLTPGPGEDKDADKNWNALSLPFVVGPKGRIGKLRPTAFTSSTTSASQASTKP